MKDVKIPQLMPLLWKVSFVLVFIFLITMVVFYGNLNMMKYNNYKNMMIMKNSKWYW